MRMQASPFPRQAVCRLCTLPLQSAPAHAAVPLSDIVSFVSGRYDGPADAMIEGVLPLSEAGERHISFLSNPKYAPQLRDHARGRGAGGGGSGRRRSPRWIRVANPYFAMARVVAPFLRRASGAERDLSAGLDRGLGEARSERRRRRVHRHRRGRRHRRRRGDLSERDHRAERRPSATAPMIYPQVSIYYGSRIGRRCVIHSGVVIGSDGYGFATDGGRASQDPAGGHRAHRGRRGDRRGHAPSTAPPSARR